MTTVAYRNGELATDTQGSGGGKLLKVQKIHRANGHIIAFAGTVMDGLQFVKWWADKTKELKFIQYRGGDDAPDFVALVLGTNSIERWTEHLLPEPVLDEFYAIGSGEYAALAAMHMGATAVEAVKVASLVDVYTGPDVESMKI